MRYSFLQPVVAYYQRLTARERVLLLAVGGTLLAVANLILLSVMIHSWTDLNQQYTAKSQDLERELVFADQRTSLWEPRNAWLKKTQPAVANRNLAGPQLQEAVKNLAQSSQVLITNTKFATFNPTSDYQPVSVGINTQSDWKSVVRFMASVQKPEAFLVFNTARLHTETSDPSQIRGDFVISKWYAPAGK